jgi:HD-GYP domain-containing protein (c-di-GMP phosphodiesterase class II)
LEPLLTPKELELLSIQQGSLDATERIEIQSHVRKTFDFLKQIRWTKELNNIPRIARAHHERMDGSGYPDGLRSEEIPLQSRMMAIADIFDALTAADRPWKPAVPVELALSIIRQEVNSGLLDPHLFQLFLDARIYQLIPSAANPNRPAHG